MQLTSMGLQKRPRSGPVSDNSGKKAITYEATLPNGTVVRQKSFNVNQPDAFLGCFQDAAKRWLYSGIVATPQNWSGQIFIKARKVSK